MNSNHEDEQLMQYYELAQHQMDRAHEAYGRLQTKTSTLLGFGFVLMGFEVSILDNLRSTPLVWLPSVTIIVALVLLCLTYRSRTIDTAPNIDLVEWHVQKRTPMKEVIPEAVEAMNKAFDSTRTEMIRVGRLVNVAIWLILIGTALRLVLILFAIPQSCSAAELFR